MKETYREMHVNSTEEIKKWCTNINNKARKTFSKTLREKVVELIVCPNGIFGLVFSGIVILVNAVATEP